MAAEGGAEEVEISNSDPEKITKKCRFCHKQKSLEEYSVYLLGNSSTRKATCKTCEHNTNTNMTVDKYLSFLLRRANERIRAQQRSTQCKKLPGEVTITLQHLLELWDRQQGRCALSGTKMTITRSEDEMKNGGPCMDRVSIDRIDSDENYIVGNVQLVAHKINFMKGQMRDDDFVKACENIVCWSVTKNLVEGCIDQHESEQRQSQQHTLDH